VKTAFFCRWTADDDDDDDDDDDMLLVLWAGIDQSV
jgi:hypothetical protein